MKKLSQSYLKGTITPIKSPSPDFKAGNKITSTKSPKNLQKNKSVSGIYASQNMRSGMGSNIAMNNTGLNNNKTWMTPTQNNKDKSLYGNNNASTNYKYFSANRHENSASNHHHNTHNSHNSNNFNNTMKFDHPHSLCRQNNQEIIYQLKKLMNLITNSTNGYYSNNIQGQYLQEISIKPQSQSIKHQVNILDTQNHRLVQLIKQLQIKINRYSEIHHSRQRQRQQQSISMKYCQRCKKTDQITQALEEEIDILREQLNKTSLECDKQRDSILKSNKALMSQMESFRDRNQLLEKQTQSLRYLLREKQEKEQQTQRKLLATQKSDKLEKSSEKQKLSLSLIREQYNQSLKTMKNNIEYEVNIKMQDYENKITEEVARIGLLEEKLRNSERKIIEIQKNRLNSSYMSKDKEKDKEIQSLRMEIRRIENTINQNNKNYQNIINNLNIKLTQKDTEITRLVNQLNLATNKIKSLEKSLKDSEFQTDRETEIKIKKLMENYESEISILKRDLANAKNLKNDIENENQKNIREFSMKMKSKEEELENIRRQNKSIRSSQTFNKNQIENENKNLRNQVEIIRGTLNTLKMSQNSLKMQNQELRNSTISSHSYNNLERQNNQLKNMISVLKKQHKNRCQDLENQNINIKNQSYNLKQIIQKMQNQSKIIQKQLNSLKSMQNQYIQQNNKLQSQNKSLHLKLTNSVTNIYENQTFIQKQRQYNILKTQYTQQIQTKNNKINDLQLTIHNLTKILQQTQEKTNQLQHYNTKIIKQIEILQNKDRNMISIEEHQKIMNKINQDNEKQLSYVKNNYEQEITELSNKLQAAYLQTENITYKLTQVNTQKSRKHENNIKQELLQIKKLLNENKLQELQIQLINIHEMYNKELIRIQQKDSEIRKLINIKNNNQGRISQLEKIKIVLEEKINVLQGNLKINERELEQRKILCDRLLTDKSKLEKQITMLKKVRLDKETIQETKAKAKQITWRIDRLLAMEEEREERQEKDERDRARNIGNITTSYVTTSKISKLSMSQKRYGNNDGRGGSREDKN